MPRVTIITPTYNRAAYLDATVASIAAQGYDDLEQIIVDDGSTDETPARVAALQRQYPFLRAVRKDNGGEPTAVNHGWRLATGTYVCVVNSDDPQPPSLVRRSVEVLEARRDAVVSYPDWSRIDAAGEVVETIITPEHSPAHMVVNARCYVGPGAFIRRSMVRSASLRDERYRYVSDFACWLDLQLVAPFVRIPEPLAAWRDHPAAASNTGRSGPMAEELVEVIFDFFERTDLPPAIRATEAAAKCSALRTAMALCHGQNQRNYLGFRLRLLAHQAPVETLKQARNATRRMFARALSR